MKYRNTKQKELILDIIKNNHDHPTIYEIYDEVKKADASIGQATVYRNVKQFVKEGKISLLKTKQGVDRYDFYQDHFHLECLTCGKLFDFYDSKLLNQLKSKNYLDGFQVANYNLTIEGYCLECNGGKREEV